MGTWALDLGTTNSAIARWDDASGQAALIDLPRICRLPDGDDPLEAPRMVPSAVHLVEVPTLADRIGAWRPLARRLFFGRTAFIGREALERNLSTLHPAFAPGFKAALGTEAARPLARVGRRPIAARAVAHAFLRELLAEVKRTAGCRIRDLVVAAPVSAFESYRAEVQRILNDQGQRHLPARAVGSDCDRFARAARIVARHAHARRPGRPARGARILPGSRGVLRRDVRRRPGCGGRRRSRARRRRIHAAA